MELTVRTQSWPIRGSFTISRGSKIQADTVIVELTDGGVTGRGECVPYARYNESVSSVQAELEQIRSDIKGGINLPTVQSLLPSGAARNALDCALWDLNCKKAGKTIWQQTNIEPSALVTAYTLSLDTPDNMYQAALENAHRPLLKLKLGGGEDLLRVKAVRKGAPDAKIILDANEAWDVELYNALIPELMKLDIAMIEQPFPASDDEVLKSVDRPIPICADESCHDTESLTHIADRYDMINIKIDKTGGLTEALELKKQAQQAGLKVMVGCMLSSSLSMAPAFVVAQGAEIVDLDGPLLLAQDIEHGFEFSDKQMMPFTPELWG
jgi:L-alanine-DL-glutamate epimerase-like enolase superfamily enzyme